MNVVMTEKNGFIEIQGTAERETFAEDELNNMLSLAKNAIQELIKKQREILAETL